MKTGKFKVHRNSLQYNFVGRHISYWWFTLSASNGKVIAASEMYNSKRACISGIKSVIKNAATATIEEIK